MANPAAPLGDPDATIVVGAADADATLVVGAPAAKPASPSPSMAGASAAPIAVPSTLNRLRRAARAASAGSGTEAAVISRSQNWEVSEPARVSCSMAGTLGTATWPNNAIRSADRCVHRNDRSTGPGRSAA